MKKILLAAAFLGLSSLGFGAAITLSSNPFLVDSTGSGHSFVYTGTLTQADTLAFTVTGLACLQPGNTFCTNAAGVIVTAGSNPVGTSLANGATSFGSLLITISGVGSDIQIFPTNAANGLGSGSPTSTLTLSTTTLGTLFGGSFSVVNPTITFSASDTARGDNSGSFSLTQTASGVPEPSTILLSLAGLAAIAIRRRK